MARREMDVYCNQSSFFGTEFRMCSFESASNTPSYMIATALDEGHILSAYIRALMPRLSGANTSEECIDDLGNRKSLRDKAYIVAVFFYLDVFSLLSEENHLNGARLQYCASVIKSITFSSLADLVPKVSFSTNTFLALLREKNDGEGVCYHGTYRLKEDC